MIELDMNQASFQTSFFQLEKAEVISVTNACKKIRQLTWEQFYQHSGFNWEWISGKEYYTFRVSDKIRVAALRKGNLLELQRIFTDHDSAYA